jgi:two-component system, NtrC family, sensor kinase
LVRLTRELNEALERQTATSEVLQSISRYPGDLQPVFQAMLKNAVRLCDAKFGNIYRWDGDALHLVATENAPVAFAQARGRSPLRPGPETPTGRMIANKTVVHATDMRAEKAYADRDPYIVAGIELGGVRTVLMVPMLKDDELIGAFSVYRQEVRPFTDKQIALVQNFAAQAVIAIDNTRLLNELRQRTNDLTEALEQQTAASAVFGVISSSPGKLETVFQAILENATRICEAKFGLLFLFDGSAFHLAAEVGTPVEFLASMRQREAIKPPPGSHLDRVMRTKQISHTADYAAEGISSPPVILGGARSTVDLPLLKDDQLVGVFSIYRQEVRPFTEKQIALLTNFADQAVIAIENARLLNELRQRTADVTEALEQQTATSEVLHVISSSRGQLDPVFQTILANATRICDANFGILNLHNEGSWPVAAMHNVPEAFVELRQREPMLHFGPDHPLGRVAATKEVLHIADVRMTAGYRDGDQAHVTMVDVAGARTVLLVPMLKENELIGAITIYRQEVRPFNDKQMALLQNFAAQAVIAIENTRLLNELRQSLQQQTAKSEVLPVISSSPGDLRPVFATMLESAARICDAKFGNIFRWDGDALTLAATYNTPPAFFELLRLSALRPYPENPIGRMVSTKAVVHVADLAEERPYIEKSDPNVVAAVELGGIRTFAAVPMLKENKLMGALIVYRQAVRPFTEKQVALVTNFAAQAVIAIENARLLGELRERTEEVVKLNQQLEQRVADQVGEIERMGKLRRFLPPQVADLIVASGSEKQLESHRREITALFCDLRGFTGFTESADAEDVMALLPDYHAAIGEIIIKYSGTLERYAGDGVMVVFNDPVPVESPALQAVFMALELRDALGALTATWSRLGHEIGFGIGIAHGFATLGTIGYEGRFDYAAIGTVSNVASRLCDEAKPGQILISPRVLTKVENAVKVEPVGEFELKGIRRPLAAYNVVDLVSAKTLDAQS